MCNSKRTCARACVCVCVVVGVVNWEIAGYPALPASGAREYRTIKGGTDVEREGETEIHRGEGQKKWLLKS